MHAAIATITSRFPRDRVSRRVMTLGVGQICGYGVQLAAIPILTRLYTPDEFGLFAAFSAIVVVCAVVATLRYEASIPLAADDRQAFHLLMLTVGLCIALVVISTMAFLPIADSVLAGLNASGLRPFVMLIALSIGLCGTYQGLAYWLLKREAFGKLVKARVTLSIGTACFQIGLGLAIAGPQGLILGYVIGYALACLIIGTHAFAGNVRQTVTIQESIAAAKDFRRFPQFGVWGTLVGTLAVHLPAILFMALFGPVAAGLYLLANRCLAVPMSLLHYPVSRVYLSEAARLYRERPTALADIYQQTVCKILILATGPVAVAMLIAPWLFEWAFGSEWAEAGVVCRILAPLMLAQLIWLSVQSTLDIIGRQELEILFSGGHAAFIVLALVAGCWMGASITTTAVLLSASGSLAYLLSLWLTWRLVQSSARNTRDSVVTLSP